MREGVEKNYQNVKWINLLELFKNTGKNFRPSINQLASF